jgi:hypothetical protein
MAIDSMTIMATTNSGTSMAAASSRRAISPDGASVVIDARALHPGARKAGRQ